MRGMAAGTTLLLIACAGCAHAPRPAVVEAARDFRCEDAAWLASVAPARADDTLRLAVSAPASVVLTGAGYAVDVTALATAGVAAGVAICAPIAALEGAVGGGELGSECFSAVAGGIVGTGALPGAGRTLRRATRTWRCSDHVPRSAEARAVAACYVARGWPGDAWLASRALEPLRDPRFRACLPARELRRADRALAELDGALEEVADASPGAAEGAE